VIPIERIRAAAESARPHVLRSPLVPVEGALLKLECLQPTGSFKVRGFFAAALALPPERLRRGLITVSAGNAAQACAYVARQLDVPCRVFMYDTAPPPKLAGVKRWGATPILLPRDELLLARVLVPVGGGGLVSGIASALKGSRPEIEVVGVQSDGYPLWIRSFEAGGPVSIQPDTIADGTTAPFDARMFELLKECVDRWLMVPEPRLRAAVPELASAAKVVAEGAGALAYAALEQLEPGPTTVAVVSGGNIDPKLLAAFLS
ncbi:MAG: pyridoxal-phosphate dependent enzyme, partial [Chloroflexi bacterium]